MDWKNQLTKTPFLILFVILISVGVASAYAINITLGGTVDITQILNMMGNKITNVGTPTASTDAATKAYVDDAFAVSGVPYVPFKTQIVLTGDEAICNAAADGSSNPRIRIDNPATSGTFMVTSVIIQPDGIPPITSGAQFISTNEVIIDGQGYTLRSGNLIGGSSPASPVDRGFDIMGTPLTRTSVSLTLDHGGVFPHTIIADSAGINDIDIQLFCRFDEAITDAVFISSVLVGGWKQLGDTINLTYIPGT